eukprot:660551-Alexandrium_andersonii.AAC.1
MDGRMRVKGLRLGYSTAEDGGREQLEGVLPFLHTVAATDASSRAVLRKGRIRGHAAARTLGPSGRRWRPPEWKPLSAVTDGAIIRLQELADSGRLCWEVQ